MIKLIPIGRARRLSAFVAATVLLTLGSNADLFAQGSVWRSGSTWHATVDGNNVYTGNRMFDAVNAACHNVGNGGHIDIWDSGDSSTSPDGNLYYIRPLSGQTLDFHGNTINCNGGGDSIVAIYQDRRPGLTVRNLRITGNPRYGMWIRGTDNVNLDNITIEYSGSSPVGIGIRVNSTNPGANSTSRNTGLTIGTVTVSGTPGHAVETYSIDNIRIDRVNASHTAYGAGLLINDGRDVHVNEVYGDWIATDSNYATVRVANATTDAVFEYIHSRNAARGFYNMGGNHGTRVHYVDIRDSRLTGISITNQAHNIRVWDGIVQNSGYNVDLWNGYYDICVYVNGQYHGDACDSGGGGTVYDRLRNRATGMFVDGMGRTADGSDLGQWANTNHENSHWEVVHVGDYRKFRNRTSGLFIDGMGRTSNGSTVGQWSDGSSHNQQWWRDSPASGWYRFQNRATGLYLDGMGRTDNGSDVGQWANTSSHNAQWEYLNP